MESTANANLGWAANALVQVANNPFAILALLLIVISSVAIWLIPPTQAVSPGIRLAALATLAVLFLFLMGFALKVEQTEATFATGRTAQVQLLAVQNTTASVVKQLNDEITQRDAQIAQLKDRLNKLTDNTANQPVEEKAVRELQGSVQNSHCSGPISKSISVTATPGWKIMPNSIQISELFVTGTNSRFEGPFPSNPSQPDEGFDVRLIAANSGACGPEVLGRRIGLDGRGSIGVAIRYTEERELT